jgi:hypothetical protein
MKMDNVSAYLDGNMIRIHSVARWQYLQIVEQMNTQRENMMGMENVSAFLDGNGIMLLKIVHWKFSLIVLQTSTQHTK